MKVPRSHPRYRSLVTRENIVSDVERGITHMSGLIAHGRGEAFDYILGETTIGPALRAIEAASAALALASKPVLSVNGNVASLVPKEMIALSRAAKARLEVNLFHRTKDRVRAIEDRFRSLGAEIITAEDARIPGIDHLRGVCSKDGIYSADVVLVPLEDGDRAEALRKSGKFIITIDLNPISRTARAANVTIVDELTRAVPLLVKRVGSLVGKRRTCERILSTYDNEKVLREVLRHMRKRLDELMRGEST
jgi:4-phosphopantoate--beta-alanine ligase